MLVLFKYQGVLAVDFKTTKCVASPVIVKVEIVNVDILAKYIVADEASAAEFKVSDGVVKEELKTTPPDDVLDETTLSNDNPCQETA